MSNLLKVDDIDYLKGIVKDKIVDSYRSIKKPTYSEFLIWILKNREKPFTLEVTVNQYLEHQQCWFKIYSRQGFFACSTLRFNIEHLQSDEYLKLCAGMLTDLIYETYFKERNIDTRIISYEYSCQQVKLVYTGILK